MPIDNSVVSMFGSMSTFASATADTGAGFRGETPPEGLSDNKVLSIDIKPGTMKLKNAAGAETSSTTATGEITFTYEWIRDSKDPSFDPTKPPLVWAGEVFRMIPDRGVLANEGQRQAAEIAERRLKGHISKLLKRAPEECTNLQVCLTELASLLDKTRVIASVKLVHREGTSKKPNAKPTIYKTEYIEDRLA